MGTTYRVDLSPAARRQLGRLPPEILARLSQAIDALAADPRPSGVQKLPGSQNDYRIRVGDYRVIYEVQDEVLLVLVTKVAHRREAYR